LGIFSNIRQRRVDAGKPLLFPNLGTVPTATPGSPGANKPTPGSIADDLKEQEAKRQADILAGRGKIDEHFARFNDGYYQDFADNFLNYYFPQIEDQYRTATGKSHAALVNRGIDQSTVAGGVFSNLLRDRTRARTDIANNATNATQGLRSNVERTRTDLYNLNESAADPAAANARATAEASALVAPPTVGPLGQIFSAAMMPVMYGAQSYRNRAPAPYTSPYGGTGSGTVVR
jgi:hypothetical protein